MGWGLMGRCGRSLRAEQVALLVALWLTLLCNGVLWQRLWSLAGMAVLAPLAGLLLLSSSALLLLLLWPRVWRPLLAALLLLSAASSHFMLQYGVLIDVDMVRNALQTNVAEAGELFSGGLLLSLLLLGVLPACWLWRLRPQFRPWRRELLCRLLALLGCVLLAVVLILPAYPQLASLLRNHRELRHAAVPGNYLYAGYRYLRAEWSQPPVLQRIGMDARRRPAAGKPRVLLLVIGETARADHFALNGYPRPTTPRLARMAGLINYPNAWSCGTATAVSLPCMFSDRGRAEFDVAEAPWRENLLDVLQRAGVAVSWRDNNSGCKEVCRRVPSEMLFAQPPGKHCRGEACFDEVLLDDLAPRLAGIEHDSVIVLHQQGSHGPAYYRRYPAAFSRFTPVCRHEDLARCTREEIVNAYDNTILYTDYVLAQTIAMLQRAEGIESALLYLSDHGESLGEHNLYLHGTPYAIAPDAQKHIPMLAWFSPSWLAAARLAPACLHAGRGAGVSQDQLFHSVLGLMAVDTRLYRRELDLYAGCRGV